MWAFFGVISVGAGVVVACDDSTDQPPPTTTIDGGGVQPDSSTPQLDAFVPPEDAGTSDSPTGPTVSVEHGSTGIIMVFEDALIAQFHEDDTIVRASTAPECVATLRSLTKPGSPAGKLTLTGDHIGKDGGPPTAVKLDPDPSIDNIYESYLNGPPFFFPRYSGLKVLLALEGTQTMPPLSVTPLNSPVAKVTVTAPMQPDAGASATMQTGKDYELAWLPGDAGAAGQRIILNVTILSSENRTSEIRCSWPLAAGKGTVPVALLKAVKAQLGGTAPLSGRIDVLSGDAKESTTGGSSYFTFATLGADSTTFVSTELALTP